MARLPQMKSVMMLALALGLSSGLWACDRGNPAADQIARDSAAVQATQSRLVFDNITLEQADEDGNIVWRIKAEQAEYSPDQKIAIVTNPDGELLQDGEPIYEVQGKRGEVHQDGERVFLREGVVATDTRSGAILTGDELEWIPGEGRLIVRGNLKGTHPQVNAVANEAQVFTRDRRMELNGRVAATTKDPNLRLQAEKLIWFMAEERIESPQAVTIDRYAGTQVTDTATGNRAEVQLKTQTANLQQNARLTISEPPLLITSENLLWNLQEETVTTDQPVQIVHRAEQVTVTANQGRMNLKEQVAYLSQNVQAVGQRNDSRLNSNELTWTLPTQQLIATGNVVYRQANPSFTLTGDRAVGRLENQTVVVSGGQTGDRVVTEIIPEGL